MATEAPVPTDAPVPTETPAADAPLSAGAPPPADAPLLRVSGVAKSWPGGRQVLAGLDFSLDRGSTLAIVGPSGGGKSTLLALLCGLARPDAGQVLIEGRHAPRPGRDAAIIPQDHGLLPWRTVLENAALGLKIAGVPRAERDRAAREELAALGLAGRDRDYPWRLSGGESQRVAIARAFAARPSLLLLDEPFSALDAITRHKLQDTLLDIWRARRTPWVLVTHSVAEAVLLGGRIAVLAGRPAAMAAWFDNPGFAQPGGRDSAAFSELVRAVRASLEAHS